MASTLAAAGSYLNRRLRSNKSNNTAISGASVGGRKTGFTKSQAEKLSLPGQRGKTRGPKAAKAPPPKQAPALERDVSSSEDEEEAELTGHGPKEGTNGNYEDQSEEDDDLDEEDELTKLRAERKDWEDFELDLRHLETLTKLIPSAAKVEKIAREIAEEMLARRGPNAAAVAADKGPRNLDEMQEYIQERSPRLDDFVLKQLYNDVGVRYLVNFPDKIKKDEHDLNSHTKRVLGDMKALVDKLVFKAMRSALDLEDPTELAVAAGPTLIAARDKLERLRKGPKDRFRKLLLELGTCADN